LRVIGVDKLKLSFAVSPQIPRRVEYLTADMDSE
jgi:hypothetical protein